MTVSTEGNRYYFEHPETGLGVDVFMNELYFCHRIPFDGRLDLDRPTISTADLLLEKMQIVELNLKDITDTMVLMLEHPIANGQARHGGDRRRATSPTSCTTTGASTTRSPPTSRRSTGSSPTTQP